MRVLHGTIAGNRRRGRPGRRWRDDIKQRTGASVAECVQWNRWSALVSVSAISDPQSWERTRQGKIRCKIKYEIIARYFVSVLCIVTKWSSKTASALIPACDVEPAFSVLLYDRPNKPHYESCSFVCLLTTVRLSFCTIFWFKRSNVTVEVRVKVTQRCLGGRPSSMSALGRYIFVVFTTASLLAAGAW